jgi:predicted dehydrogenase
MSLVKLGIIGCGKVVTCVHLDALRHVRHARVSAVADPVEEKRSQAARRCHGAASFAGWQELLEHGDVEAVLICTPSADHAECAIRAFAQGKHVYLEKPMAATLAQAEEVRQAWKKTDLVGMMGFNYRHHPFFMQAREVVQSGRLGTILGVQSSFTSSGAWVHDWKRKRVSAGGVLFDLATHHIDLTHFVFGHSVAEVSAHVASNHSEQDTAWLRMTLQNGVMVQSFFSLYGTDTNQFEIHGESARLTINYVTKRFQITPRGQREPMQRIVGALGRETLRLKNVLATRRDPSYETAFVTFVNAIADGRRQVEPDLNDGLRVSLVIDAAEQSAATGQSRRVAAFPAA